MKSSLFEYYKKKYSSDGKIPVRKTGMWYQDGDVVVPSNNITMKGPDGEKDYFDSPILGIGLLSGDTQVMEPGKDYLFPKDNAVLEKKMQKGAKTESTEMTPEQKARFDAYMRSSNPRSLSTPDWLDLSSSATNYARRLKRMNTEELMSMPGDISKNVSNAFKRGIDYSIDYSLPKNAGQISTEGNYNPFGENTLESMYSGLTYSQSFPKGSIRLSPDEQEVKFRGKAGNVKYKRQVQDDEVISNLAFDLNVLPEALNIYGQGSISDFGVTPGVMPNKSLSYANTEFDPQYRVRGGIRGNVGPVSYDLSGDYNPDTGYRYSGDANLALLKNRLNFSGSLSGSEQGGIESMSAEARARLFKNLNLKAGYRKSGDKPARFNVGLSYNKFFEEGGEVENEEDEREDDKEMVEGIADILRKVKDKKNRKEIAKKMVDDFDEEEVEYNLDDFMEAAQVMQMGGMSMPGVNGMIVASSPMSLKDTYKNKKK
jgi:hypothetical protein